MIRTATALCLLIFTTGAGAGPVLSEDCESAMALSALPQHLRDQASVVGLTDSGYRELRRGDGPFTCIVERNHPDALIPQCVDAAGADTIIPALVWKSERVLAGEDAESVVAAFDRKAAAGEFRAPGRAGLSYMLSPYNDIFIPERGEIVRIHPHVMFYAPGLSNDDIGGSFEAARSNRGMPFVLTPGIHGYMITFVEEGADGEQVAVACAGQLDDERLGLHRFPSTRE